MKGLVSAIHGDIVVIEFSGGLPGIHDVLAVEKPDGTRLLLEVHDHVSRTAVKAIALGFTEGLQRGLTVTPGRRSAARCCLP